MTDDPNLTPPDPRAPDAPDPNAETAAYTPAPERRPDWASPGWSSTAWTEPAPGVPPTATQPVASPAAPRFRRPGGVGQLLATALLSAVLASGGTIAVLESTGALNHPATAAGSQPAASHQPVSIDENSAIVDVAAAVS